MTDPSTRRETNSQKMERRARGIGMHLQLGDWGAIQRVCEDLKRYREAAKLLLGHVSTDTTDIYLLEEVQETIRAAKRLHAAERQ